MASGHLNQDDIDRIMGFGSEELPNIPPPTIPKNGELVLRQYQQSHPIYYKGSIEPDYYSVKTIVESWNIKTTKWEYYTSFSKLYYPNGFSVH